MITKDNNVLNIIGLNCCGIKKRLNYEEFEKLIRKNDIICLVETKTDDIDTIKLTGYEFHMKNRKAIAKTRSGGIILGYKKEIASKIKPLATHCKYVLWFKISSDLLNLDQDIVIGIVYIPPEYTVFSSHDAFSQLEDEYKKFSQNYKFVALRFRLSQISVKNRGTNTKQSFLKYEEYDLEIFHTFKSLNRLSVCRVYELWLLIEVVLASILFENKM